MTTSKFRVAACVAAMIAATTLSAVADPVHRSARIVRSSDDLVLTKSDHAIGVMRARPTRMLIELPPDADPDQEFVIDDLAGDFNAAWVTVQAPAGHTIGNNRRTVTLSIDGEHAVFRYFGDRAWGFEQ